MEKIIDKIQKLLRLAEGNSNENEAQAAMLKAQSLIAQYSISENDLESTKTVKRQIIVLDQPVSEASGRTPWYAKTLGGVISKNFKCFCYIRHSHGKTAVHFVGSEENLAVGKNVYKYAVDSINNVYKSHIKELKKNIPNVTRTMCSGFKNTFIQGFISGLNYKFESQIKDNKWEMVIVKEKEVDEYVSQHLTIRKPTATGIKPKFDGRQETYERGFNEGKNFANLENSTKKISHDS